MPVLDKIAELTDEQLQEGTSLLASAETNDMRFYREAMLMEIDRRGGKFEKGDKPGHPFRGNQWSGGTSVSTSSDTMGLRDEDLSGWKEDAKFCAGMAIANATRNGDPTEAIVGRVDGELVGIMSWTFNGRSPETSDAISVDWLATKRTGEGFGVEMMLSVCRKAAGMGKGVELEATDTAIKFYEKFGMTNVGRNKMTLTAEETEAIVNANKSWRGDLNRLEPKDGVFAVSSQKFEKGDKPGHPFRGNQWTGGRAGEGSASSSSLGLDDALDALSGEQPPNYATEVRKIDQTSIKSDSPITQGGINGGAGVNVSRVVEIEDGDGVVRKYCFKPDVGEDPRVHLAYRGRQSTNEVASSVIDEAMGLDMVAKTEMVEIGGKKGSLQQWINDDAELAVNTVDWNADNTIKSRARLDAAEGVADMMYFDALTGNTDRHLGNYLVKDGKIKLIDNGMSMGVNYEYGDESLRFRTMEHAGSARMMKGMTPKFKAALGKMLGNREAVDAKLKAAGMHERNRDSFWKRAAYLQKAGMVGFGDSTMRDLSRLAEGRPLF